MDSGFEIAITVLLAFSLLTLIGILCRLYIHLPAVRRRSDFSWDSKVLGEWAKYKTLRLRSSLLFDFKKDEMGSPIHYSSPLSPINPFKRLLDFEYVTVLELPVIFLARADNTGGPIDGEIWYIDGSERRWKETCTTAREHFRHTDSVGSESFPRERIRTTANDRASWLELLEVLRRMERDSVNWESRQWREKDNKVRPEQVEVASLVVGVQRYKRVFDSATVFNRPFATTTLCHLVEFAAVLGLYWKQFDRNED